ncbi:MAG: thioredoxin peroxidase [Candidatus Cloacimonadota bacterium]|nr:MAG: thioredoxin peroxidase [Candidatus Cloacimonadota bacterium]PIE78891.1 MAG: thioredoxin peroxidase [Candidatus Delongbacteria bacterium]
MMVLVGRKAPDFKATALVNGNEFKEISLSDYKGKYVLLFFYPLDFTFVCPTEIHAFQNKLEEFKKRGVEVIGVSIDSQFSHFNWVKTPKSQGGIEGTTYPLIADLNKTITRDYDVEVPGAGIAFRANFLIDKEGVVQHQSINNTDIGRNVDELIRLVDALQFTEKHGEVCPANWNEGDKSMKPTAEGLGEYFG